MPRRVLQALIALAVFLAVVDGFHVRDANAAPKWRRTALHCEMQRHLIWTARLCVTIHVRKVGGQWQVRAAAVTAGYNRQGRRKMTQLVAVSFGGRTTVGRAFTRREVVRTRWMVPDSIVVPPATSVHVVRWPNGDRSAYRLWSRP
jgi:hypothetical protein